MGVAYGPREAPPERKRGASASASSAKPAEVPAAKKAEVVGPQTARISSAKAPKGNAERPSPASMTKSAAGGSKESKGKGIYPYGYSFHIVKEDLGSDAFMRELRATESNIP